jgi:hypothetical protein
MLPIIGYPSQLPKWATTAANRSEPSESDKAAGHAQGQASPAYEENWRANLVYQWVQKIPALNLKNWFGNTDVDTWDIYSAIYHPEIGLWCVSGNNATTKYSTDGYTWGNGGTIDAGGFAAYRFAAIDDLYYIMASDGTADNLKYTTDPTGAWSTIVSATIGGSGNMTAIATKYPDDRMCILSRNSGASLGIRITNTTILGTWVGPTTPPPSVPASSLGLALFWVSGNTWLLLCNTYAGDRSKMKLYKTLDDGDTWADVPGILTPYPSGSYGAIHLAHNPSTGRIVSVGSDAAIGTPNEFAAYSDDLGDTWTASTIDNKGYGSGSILEQVYYCGGNAWVAIAKNYDPDENQTVYVSTDDGATWEIADMNDATYGSNNLTVLACDERRLMAFGDAGFNVHSLGA